jgi:hypothetical protein
MWMEPEKEELDPVLLHHYWSLPWAAKSLDMIEITTIKKLR